MFYSKKEDTMLRPLLAFLMAFRIGLTTPQKQPKDCQFPSTWEGTWYHSGFPHPLNISAKHISSKGTCVQQSGSMFIMVDRYVIFLISWTFICISPISSGGITVLPPLSSSRTFAPFFGTLSSLVNVADIIYVYRECNLPNEISVTFFGNSWQH